MNINDAIRIQTQRENAESAIEGLRQERDYWREECEKRAEWISSNWSQYDSSDDDSYCPGCGLSACYIRSYGHKSECHVVPLMQMPEGPKA